MRKILRHLQHHVKIPRLFLLRVEQPRVLNRNRHLRGERVENEQVFVAERIRFIVLHVQHANRFLTDDQRNCNFGTRVARNLVGIQNKARLFLDIVYDHRFAQCRHPADNAFQTETQSPALVAPRRAARVRARSKNGITRVRIYGKEVDFGIAKPFANAIDDLLEQFVNIEHLSDLAANIADYRKLRGAFAFDRIEPRILNRDGGLRGHRREITRVDRVKNIRLEREHRQSANQLFPRHHRDEDCTARLAAADLCLFGRGDGGTGASKRIHQRFGEIERANRVAML